MTKIALSPNASGTGTFTIAAPNSNTNRTFTLPDATGEVLTDQSNLASAKLTGDVAAARITNALNASGSAPIYACRAWVNFDGTLSSGNIRASGNVSSVTRNGTGDYTVNFTTAMPDADYSVVGTGGRQGSSTTFWPAVFVADNLVTPTTTSVRIVTFQTNNLVAVDVLRLNVAIFR